MNDIDAKLPICVDLDGTLINTDLLFESTMTLLRQNLLYLICLPIWLMKGRAYLKRQIATRIDIDPCALPYHAELLEFLKTERNNGRDLVLATASDQKYAECVSSHLGLFTQAFGSDGITNLSQHRKSSLLEGRFGKSGFVYAGNSYADVPVWQVATASIVVAPEGRLLNKVKKDTSIHLWRTFERPKNLTKSIINSLRIHQWVKNLLIFVPAVTSHKIFEPLYFEQSLIAFIAFSLCASSVYVLNDIVDVNADRIHPKKRNRPIASGNLPLSVAFGIVPILLCVSFAVAIALPNVFMAWLAFYFAFTLAYTFFAKRIALLDVLFLAGLFTARIAAGQFATGIEFSPWLFAFSGFFFLSLAFLKRYTEVNKLKGTDLIENMGRSYRSDDLDLIRSLGTASAYASILIFALYVDSNRVRALYRHPGALWFIAPILVYWVSRVWLLAHRGELDYDPIVFALKDKVSYVLLAITAIIIVLATRGFILR